eukprot:gene14747-biopygen14210
MSFIPLSNSPPFDVGTLLTFLCVSATTNDHVRPRFGPPCAYAQTRRVGASFPMRISGPVRHYSRGVNGEVLFGECGAGGACGTGGACGACGARGAPRAQNGDRFNFELDLQGPPPPPPPSAPRRRRSRRRMRRIVAGRTPGSTGVENSLEI